MQTLNILFIGDVFGKIGRQTLIKEITRISQEEKVDFIIANTENATHGKSLSFAHYQELEKAGVHCFTMGNHTFNNFDLLNKITEMPKLVRPLNFSELAPGVGSRVFKIAKQKIRVTNLLGRSFMALKVDNPFLTLEKIVKRNQEDFHIVDFHAEATAEKITLGLHFDGKVTAVLGTHTHVQTVDARILPEGTFFISDVGMTGPHFSVIGADFKNIIKKERTNLPSKIIPAKGPGQFSAVFLKLDCTSKKVINYKNIYKVLD